MVWAERRQSDGGALLLRADYTYDVWGRRIEKTVDPDGAGPQPAQVTRFAYDGANAWADLDGNSSLTTRRLYLDAVDAVFARIDASGEAAWYLPDRLGSVRDIVTTSGGQNHLDYDGFGNVVVETNPVLGDRYRWTSREYDAETGWQYHRARYYDPATGRWTSEDPIGFTAGDANLYRYVGNSPPNFVDPWGLQMGGPGIAAGYPPYPTPMSFGAGGGYGGIGGFGGSYVPSNGSFYSPGGYGPYGGGIGVPGYQTDFLYPPIPPGRGSGAGSRLSFWDVVQGILDVVGIIDPTPITDLTNAGISLARGDYVGAGLSAVSALPYWGDAIGKGGKLARYGGKVVEAASSGKATTKALAAPPALSAPAKDALRVAPQGRFTGAFLEGPPAYAERGLGVLQGRQIAVSQRGLTIIETHIEQGIAQGYFVRDEAVQAMIGRIRQALARGERITGADASFYMHEIYESTFLQTRLTHPVFAHHAALDRYGVSQFSVIHPDVIRAMPSEFNQNWVDFWVEMARRSSQK